MAEGSAEESETPSRQLGSASPGREHGEPKRTRSSSPPGTALVTPKAVPQVTAQLLRLVLHKLTWRRAQEGSYRH